jgi:cytochrome c oxidase cbb3-type subunit 3
MSSRCPERLALLAALALVAGCEREERLLRTAPGGTSTAPAVRNSGLVPGPTGTAADSLPPEQVDDTVAAPSFVTDSLPRRALHAGDASPYETRAHAVAEGKVLWEWMNCVGCHAEGGGAIGPALIDDAWLYGSTPQQIYASIVEGRPNGMPSFGGRLTDSDVWKLVAYVQSMNAVQGRSSRSGRGDDIRMRVSEQRLPRPPARADALTPRENRPAGEKRP